MIDREVLSEQYAAGKTLQEIANGLGVSRQRIHQIVSKMGLERDPNMFIEQHGCTRRRLESIKKVAPTALKAFREQKRNALKRGIEWDINFSEWWDVWEKSGKWFARGRGEYVMCRDGDSGSYKVGNVRIATQSENSLEYLERRYLDKRQKCLSAML